MDKFNREWIIEQAIDVCKEYEYGVLTIRAMHYQLVGRGMTNDINHYKRVVNAMIDARWEGLIAFDQFSDRDRNMVGKTNADITNLNDEIEQAKSSIESWMKLYSKNRWENQSNYPEVLIEKKALEGVFNKPCDELNVALGSCKGYPSLTFLKEMSDRFKLRQMQGKRVIVIYFGDYDPSGEDIPRSILVNLVKLGVDRNMLELRRHALNHDQVVKWKLPHAPAKKTDSRTKNWDGLGQVELDAVKPEKLREMCLEAINICFDGNFYDELLRETRDEKKEYRKQLKQFVNTLKTDDDEEN